MNEQVQRTDRLVSVTTDEGQPPESGLDLTYLESTIGYAIRRAQMAVFQDIYRTFAELNVTTVQFSVLAVVADNPGANQADLASALGVERPRMVPIIDSLEKRGLAKRVASVKDRRHRQIFLTDQGRVLLEELKRRFAEHQQRMLQRLGTDHAQTMLGQLWLLAKPNS
ncbi:MarR family winged helix-turn-helix transcriptional regulator [Mesorhizobium australicum]|uniref:Transcriptional regulator, MarR family n=1 Tax=Mesorhizobium australicum TaxID=536018 RepID=A0A1X7MSU3_9HYPH|nr:MarR family transcriptional regulator [Mesorhizobium australicum]SMH27785.1 transcriptional regulator, MarR family [Mesorhizobium australicum]